MVLISHRGNINGRKPKSENNPKYIKSALDLGYDVEIDIWYTDNKFYLGHDDESHEIEFDYLFNDKFWIHCKNIGALDYLVNYDRNKNSEDPELPNYFWHQDDDFTLTSKNIIWTYPGETLTTISVCVLPEISDSGDSDISLCYGICSDYIEKYKPFSEQ